LWTTLRHRTSRTPGLRLRARYDFEVEKGRLGAALDDIQRLSAAA
jgi:hypothetical protein